MGSSYTGYNRFDRALGYMLMQTGRQTEFPVATSIVHVWTGMSCSWIGRVANRIGNFFA